MLTHLRILYIPHAEGTFAELASKGLQFHILTCLLFHASGKSSNEHDVHDGRKENIGLCPWKPQSSFYPAQIAQCYHNQT